MSFFSRSLDLLYPPILRKTLFKNQSYRAQVPEGGGGGSVQSF